MSSQMKVQASSGYSDDHTANERAEGLRENFDELRSKIKNADIPKHRKEEMLDALDGYDDLLMETEQIYGDDPSHNDVGFADPNAQDRGLDQRSVIRREFNQALEGFRRLSGEFRAAKADASAATEAVGNDASVEASNTTEQTSDVESTDVAPPEDAETDSSDAAPGEGDSIGSLEFDGMSVDEMLNTLNDDPQQVMDHIQGLDEEDKQMAMQMLQQRLQQINQMFSMLSNLAKTRHDTAKAAINNMRV